MLLKTAATAQPASFDSEPQPWVRDIITEHAPLTTTGGYIWDAARRLCSFLESNHQQLGLSRPGVRVLELGAGLGWLGMTLARNLPHAGVVVVTEQEAGGGLDWLRHNLALNVDKPGLEAVRAEACDWLIYGSEGAHADVLRQDGGDGTLVRQPELEVVKPEVAVVVEGEEDSEPQPPASSALPQSQSVGCCCDKGPSTEHQRHHQQQQQDQGLSASGSAAGCVEVKSDGGGGECGTGGQSAANEHDDATITTTTITTTTSNNNNKNKNSDNNNSNNNINTTSGSSNKDSGGGCGAAADGDWLRQQHWDFILGSDLVYNEVGTVYLPRVMASLSRPGTRILYCHTKHRFDTFDMEFFEQLSTCGLTWREVREPGEDSPPPSPPPFTYLFPEMRIAVYDITPPQQQQ